MATSYDQIVKFLKNQELKHKYVDDDEDHELIITGSATKNFVDDDGDNQIRIFIELREDGEFIRFIAPQMYKYTGPHKEKVFQLCLMIMWSTKMMQYEYDPSDGEIRMTIEWPLEDAELTEKQMMRVLAAIVQFADEYHSAFKTAMATGEIKLEDENEKMSTIRQLMTSLSGMGASELQELMSAVEEKKKVGEAPSAL